MKKHKKSKTKQNKKKIWQTPTVVTSITKQLEFKGKLCNRSYWLIKWHEFRQPITKRFKAKRQQTQSTFETHLKIAPGDYVPIPHVFLLNSCKNVITIIESLRMLVSIKFQVLLGASFSQCTYKPAFSASQNGQRNSIFLRTVPTRKIYFRTLIFMREKKIVARIVEIK